MGIEEFKAMTFLEKDFLIDANKYLKLPDKAIQALLETYSLIHKSEDLARFLWLNHHMLFSDKINIGDSNNPKQYTLEIPDIYIPNVNIDLIKAMFPAVLLLSGLPRLLEFYKEKEIPEHIIIDTLSDVKIWMDDCYAKTKTWGLVKFWWLFNHFSGKLFRLGRLQFIHTSFKGDLRVFRNKNTGNVVALSEANIKYRTDGQMDGTNGIYDKQCAWISSFAVNETAIMGNPILPSGNAQNKLVELNKLEWREVLSKGSPVLDVHIAADGKLSHEDCGESFRSSVDFFAKNFPELSFDGYMCSSWLLDPQLQHILPRKSNIVKFQREFYLYPEKSDDFQTFERVFGNKPDDLAELKPETSMQKAILDYVNEGNKMRQASMFLLKEDLQYWGQAFYQKESMML